ncbi:MAG: hydrogenase maturation protease [Parvibaculaceae bacterium]
MLVIVGCGNLTRGDDGVGPWVAQQLTAWLTKHPKSNVRIYDGGTAGMEVMFQAKGASALIIVDACLTESEPGTLYEVPGEELDAEPENSYNLHDFRWDNALYTGRKIFGDAFPEDVMVYLIEARTIEFEIGLTPAVQATADRVVEKIVDKIERWS